MNPCDRNYSYALQDIPEPRSQETCAMCGAVKGGHDEDVCRRAITLHHMEAIRRLCEYVVWSRTTTKGIGSMMRVVSARVINPGASLSQIGAAVGMSKMGVQNAIDRIRESLPWVHEALWGATRPGRGTVPDGN